MKRQEARISKIENKTKKDLQEDEIIEEGPLKGLTGRKLSEILKSVEGATRGLPNLTQTKIEDCGIEWVKTVTPPPNLVLNRTG